MSQKSLHNFRKSEGGGGLGFVHFISFFFFTLFQSTMDAALLGLDPLFLTNVKLTIHDLLHLEKIHEDLIGM